jgi:hypothetical protein
VTCMRLHILLCLAWLTIGDESGQIDDVSCGFIREWVDEQMEGTSGAALTLELGAKAIELQAKALGTGYICQARLFADDPTLPRGLLCPPGLQCFGTPSQLRGTSLCAICLDSTFTHPTLTAPCSEENILICEQLRADPRLVNNGTCLPCMPGTLCPRGSVNLVGLAASNLCPRGSYCPDPLTLLPCPVGHWCGEGALFPIPCEGTPGQFCANGYSRYCHKGSYCPSTSEEIPCPEGTSSHRLHTSTMHEHTCTPTTHITQVIFARQLSARRSRADTVKFAGAKAAMHQALGCGTSAFCCFT